MRAVAIALLAGTFLASAGAPAMAHRLKLFAAATGRTVSGYGFFIGGGRPEGAALVARDAAGAELWRGVTAEDGGFSFDLTAPATVTLTLDAGDGHAAATTVAVDAAAAPPPAAATPQAALSSAPADPSQSVLASLIAAEVDKAVARQIRPLLEASAAAEARIRVNDILGGLGWIAGLIGTALIFARRKRP